LHCGKIKLTPELQAAVCEIIAEGNYAKVAYEACGIPRSTFYRWLRKGKKEKTGKHADFVDSVTMADAIAQRGLMRTVRTASSRSWQAAAWMLERRWPEFYGRRDRTPISSKQVKDEILGMLRDGAVTPDEVRETIGDDLALELFEEAGIEVDDADVGEAPAPGEG